MSILSKITNKFSGSFSYKKLILLLLLAILFIVTSIFVYRKYTKSTKPLTHPNTNIDHGETTENNASDASSDKKADLYLFYTDWCPHCKKTKPEWNELKKLHENNRKVNGYTLNFIEVDCEANPDLANKFNISGYPTIKLVKGNQIIEFDAKPDVKTLETFLSTVLAN